MKISASVPAFYGLPKHFMKCRISVDAYDTIFVSNTKLNSDSIQLQIFLTTQLWHNSFRVKVNSAWSLFTERRRRQNCGPVREAGPQRESRAPLAAPLCRPPGTRSTTRAVGRVTAGTGHRSQWESAAGLKHTSLMHEHTNTHKYTQGVRRKYPPPHTHTPSGGVRPGEGKHKQEPRRRRAMASRRERRSGRSCCVETGGKSDSHLVRRVLEVVNTRAGCEIRLTDHQH